MFKLNRKGKTAADKIKILPAGDSITFGMGDDGGYRKYLDVTLKQKNTDFDMVGPEGTDTASFNYNGQNVTYVNNHAGYNSIYNYHNDDHHDRAGHHAGTCTGHKAQ